MVIERIKLYIRISISRQDVRNQERYFPEDDVRFIAIHKIRWLNNKQEEYNE